MFCQRCGAEIPEDRAEFLVETGKPITCVNHSGEVAAVSFLEYGHKTAGCVITIPGTDKEAIRRAQRAYRRSR